MRKVIGIIVADPNEIHIVKEFHFIKKIANKNFEVNLYSFLNNNIYVIFSKIGLVNAAIATQYLIDQFEVEQIWNYGAVGGSLNTNLHDVIIPKKFYYHDVITPWYKRGQTPNEEEFYLNSFKKTSEFNIASGQSFVGNEEYIKKINLHFKVDLFDMESCAIAQVCHRNNIPFYCIKAISDIIGKTHTNILDINKSISTASKKALTKMLHLLKKELIKI